MDLGNLLNGWGTEASIITFFSGLLYVLKKEGILRKVRIWIRIGGNGKPAQFERRKNDNPGNPGNGPTKTEKLYKAIEKAAKKNAGEIDKNAAAINKLALDQKGLTVKVAAQCKAAEKYAENNREDHGKIFDKIEELWKAPRV